ncbi:ATP-dependent DNA helicase PIF1 [Pochonia chlamydosporia 170]|uniref:ATP-dependent DNA helicase PIF1 n=1 Tax=Pochonia chlamydosporia 170 TaxID=1380566 RepID=A0A219AN61_METCM|nr:ATP-dependent DNA helicase PIF1 [Pochonia chlamydosporia 170]OWT42277.1 ATP-dependent DNA helicase PIF1 [Pochonia chlamydosporia 170]
MPGALQNSRVMRGQGDESRSVEALKTVSRIWGVDKVQYYQWAYSGINFCNKLCAAARKVSDWEEAVVKLNMLLHRRSQQLGRRPIKYSVNPIESDDLINLRAWSHKDPYVKKNDRERISLVFSNLAARDLPAGFGFDKFGLMVRSGQQQSGGDQLSREEIESRSPWDGGDWVRDRTEGRLREGHGNLARLRTVRRIWGGDKVQYYQWAHRGEDFCKKLCTAARQVSDWDEAVVKLNRLIHRRAEQIGRRKVKQSVDPIDPDDLVNLKAWSHKDPYVKKKDREGIALSLSKLAVTDLPAGFGFDKFGLMVRTEERQLGSVEESGLGVGRCNRQNVVHTGGKQVRTDRNRRRTKVRRPRDGFASKAVARPGDLFRAFRRVRDGDEQATAQVNPGSREIRGSSLGVLGRLEVREGESMALAGIGIRISADVIRAAQNDLGQARAEKDARRGEKKRQGPSNTDGLRSKRARIMVRQERTESDQVEDLASVLRCMNEEFAEKERLSHSQEWSIPVSLEKKVSTVQEYYSAFHDVSTLPIHTCTICYLKYARVDLGEVDWDRWVVSIVEKRDNSPFRCRRCFLPGKKIVACFDCLKHLKRGALSPAAQLHTRLGCEHMFPDELKGLTPIEEKLIALNSCYGFITKYSLADRHRQSVRYPKHVKGNITVFPNNVQELVRDVLPHPLLKVLDEVHVSWQGVEKPANVLSPMIDQLS